jgi:hypothetical protein
LTPARLSYDVLQENHSVSDQIMSYDITSILDQAEEGYLIPCRSEDGTIDLFARSTCGDTLLHVAVGQCDLAAIRYLLEAGLDINTRGDYLATPLFQASLGGNIAMVGILLQLGADPEIPDHRGWMPSDLLLRGIKRMPYEYLEELLQWSIDHRVETPRHRIVEAEQE